MNQKIKKTFHTPSVLRIQEKSRFGGDELSKWVLEELANFPFFDHNQILETE